LGVRPDGTKKIVVLKIEQTEGARFRLPATDELKKRGVEDVLIATVGEAAPNASADGPWAGDTRWSPKPRAGT
jgi:transposase-like protein